MSNLYLQKTVDRRDETETEIDEPTPSALLPPIEEVDERAEPKTPVIKPKQTADRASSLNLDDGDGAPMPDWHDAISEKRPRRVGRIFHVRSAIFRVVCPYLMPFLDM